MIHTEQSYWLHLKTKDKTYYKRTILKNTSEKLYVAFTALDAGESFMDFNVYIYATASHCYKFTVFSVDYFNFCTLSNM